jgi:hypothetical protein
MTKKIRKSKQYKSRNRKNNLKIKRNKSRNRRKNNYLGGNLVNINNPEDSVTNTENMYYNALKKNYLKYLKFYKIKAKKTKTVINPLKYNFTSSTPIPPVIFNINKKENINKGKGVITKNTSNMKGGAGRLFEKFENILDLTNILAVEVMKLLGANRNNMYSVSIFNPSIVKVNELTQPDGKTFYYYVITTRVIYYTSTHDGKLLNRQTSRQVYELGRQKGYWHYHNRYPDDNDLYTTYPGSEFNKWLNSTGYWGTPAGTIHNDKTMISLFKYYPDEEDEEDVGNFIPLRSAMLGECIDARIMAINTAFDCPEERRRFFKLYITGNSWDIIDILRNPSKFAVQNHDNIPRNTIIDPATAVNSRTNGPLRNCHIDIGCNMKVNNINLLIGESMDIENLQPGDIDMEFAPDSLISEYATIYDASGVVRNMPYTAHSLANSITWDQNMEKNYALYYYTDSDHMIINYRLDGPTGMVFYHKQIDSLTKVDPLNFLLEDAPGDRQTIMTSSGIQIHHPIPGRQWVLLEPHRSDIFHRLKTHYDIYGLHFSCTTPFLDIIDGDERSLYAVGHIKFDMFNYLNSKILEAFTEDDLRGMNDATFIQNVEQYYSGEQRARDHLFNSGLEIINWTINNVMNDDEHGLRGDQKYIMGVRRHNEWGIHQGGNGNQQISFIADRNFHIRRYLLLRRFIYSAVTQNGVEYYIPRNFHPNLFYYMFIYCIDYENLELRSFSHPFVILNSNKSGALNFPMGLSTNMQNIWLSYGDGDCNCLMAIINNEKFYRQSHECNNNTRVEDVEFWVYHDTRDLSDDSL